MYCNNQILNLILTYFPSLFWKMEFRLTKFQTFRHIRNCLKLYRQVWPTKFQTSGKLFEIFWWLQFNVETNRWVSVKTPLQKSLHHFIDAEGCCQTSCKTIWQQKAITGRLVNNYLLLRLSVLTLVALNQGRMRITNYVPITLLRNKYIYLFIFYSFYSISLPSFEKGKPL